MRVLILAAAGGVGLAAIQMAQQAGAEIYATASPSKWSVLKSLGVNHIYNSRTLDFADQVLADTHGQGVDVVLNSLTSEGFIAKSLSILKQNGRFIEIGKQKIWDKAQVAAAKPNVRYEVFDLVAMIEQQPPLIQTLLCELMPRFAQGELRPLPVTTFPITDAVSAFRYMQQAKHLGKIVVAQRATQTVSIRADATYLITGGLGGLGMLVARWLIKQGARHLMLLGRSQPQPSQQKDLETLASLGAQISVAQVDVADKAQVAQALAQVDVNFPLRGIIHAAGT